MLGAFLFTKQHKFSPVQLYSLSEQIIFAAFRARKTEMAEVIFYPTLLCYRANFSLSPAQRRLLQTFALGLNLARSIFPVGALSRKRPFWQLQFEILFYSAQTESENFTGDEGTLPPFPTDQSLPSAPATNFCIKHSFKRASANNKCTFSLEGH